MEPPPETLDREKSFVMKTFTVYIVLWEVFSQTFMMLNKVKFSFGLANRNKNMAVFSGDTRNDIYEKLIYIYIYE